MATENHVHNIKHVAFSPPPQTAHANEIGNVPPEAMDEATGDDTKDPGQLQQRNAPATEPDGKVAENTDVAMADDTTTTTGQPLIPEHHDLQTGTR